MESNVQVDKKPTKRGKKHTAETTGELPGAAAAPVTEGGDTAAEATPKVKGAPRPRKYDYGITADAQVVRLAEAPSVKRDIAVSWDATEGNPTVEVFMALGGDRHGLRVMMRRKLVKLVHEDGSEYPVLLAEGAAEATTEPAEATEEAA